MGGYAPNTRAGLIALLAIRRARAEHERRLAEAAKSGGEPTEKPKKKRGWFG